MITAQGRLQLPARLQRCALSLQFQQGLLPSQQLIENVDAPAPLRVVAASPQGQAEFSGAIAAPSADAPQPGLADAQRWITGPQADPDLALIGEVTTGCRQNVGVGVGLLQAAARHAAAKIQRSTDPQRA